MKRSIRSTRSVIKKRRTKWKREKRIRDKKFDNYLIYWRVKEYEKTWSSKLYKLFNRFPILNRILNIISPYLNIENLIDMTLLCSIFVTSNLTIRHIFFVLITFRNLIQLINTRDRDDNNDNDSAIFGLLCTYHIIYAIYYMGIMTTIIILFIIVCICRREQIKMIIVLG